MTQAEDRERTERALLAEVRAFLDDLEIANPSWDDGEEHSLSIRGARAGYSDHADQHVLYQFIVKHTRERAL